MLAAQPAAPQQAQPQQAPGNSCIAMIDTQHEDMIHDAQFDYYGKRLATCSSDRVIKIFEVSESGQQTLSAQLTGHEGPVWQVAWAHPKFGNLLGTCGYDKRVCVWKETQPGQWTLVYQYLGHEASVNSISFCPHELGLGLACGASDGSISVLTWKGTADNDWNENRFGSLLGAHQIGVTSVSWGPAIVPGSAVAPGAQANQLQRSFVSGGCDCRVKVWTMNEHGQWDAEALAVEGVKHTDWVRDVAWAPSVGTGCSLIASASADKTVIIWTLDGQNRSAKVLPKFENTVWRVSWSFTASLLSVASGDSKVTLWKQGLDGEWGCIDTVVDHQA